MSLKKGSDEYVKLIDLRRDTITLPTEKMIEAARHAPLGDSVYGEDPSQVALEEFAADFLGKEEALFVPSGTMGNLIALLSHTHRGDEVILEENAHIRLSETGGGAVVGGLMFRGIADASGIPKTTAIENAIRSDDIHYPPTGLICTEITHYRYGGIIPPLDRIQAVKTLAQRYGLPVHCDGARLLNAVVALDTDVQSLTRWADSVMISLSKGLSAPIGSILAGSRPFIQKAKRYRKMLGGGMRQTGWLCACGLVALQKDNIDVLRQDHQNARVLAEGLARLPGMKIDLNQVQTNFVLVDITETGITSKEMIDQLNMVGILATRAGTYTIRFVTSRMVTNNDIQIALSAISNLWNKIDIHVK